MKFGIINSSGNVIEWYATEDEAQAALAEMIAEDPEAVDHVNLLALDDDEAVTAEPRAAVGVWLDASFLVGQTLTTGFVGGGIDLAERSENVTDERVPVKTP